MGRLGKILASVVIVTAFASCGLFRRSTKHVEKSSLEVVEKRDSSLSEKTQKDNLQRTLKTDRGVTITETEITSITEKKGGKLSGSIGLDKLQSGEELLLKDSTGFKIRIQLDATRNALMLNAESPPEKETKHTKKKVTENKDQTESSEKKGSENVEKQVAVSQEHRQKESTHVEDVKKEPKGSIWIWLSAGALLFVIGLIWFLRRK